MRNSLVTLSKIENVYTYRYALAHVACRMYIMEVVFNQHPLPGERVEI